MLKDKTMNNATIQIQGNNSPNIQATIPTVSAVGGLCRVDAKAKRPQRDTKGQKKICTSQSSANGFLNCQFLPKTKVAEDEKTKKEIKQIEQSFYISLNQMTENYKVKPIKTKHLPYPNNLSVAFWDIKNKLKKHLKNNQKLHIIKTEEGQTLLSISNSYEVESYLYYLNIYSLYKLLRRKEEKQTSNLLLSVFSYLYRIVGIPYYQEEDSYLFYMYDMLNDWISEDEECYEEAERQIIISEKIRVDYIGKIVLKKIKNENNLFFWKQRLDDFKIKDEFDLKLFEVATKFYGLWKDYPTECIFRNATIAWEDTDEAILPMHRYLSFVCSFEGILQDQMNEFVNNDLNIYSEMEEPTIYQTFNDDKVTEVNFDFEHRFFTLFEQLLNLF